MRESERQIHSLTRINNHTHVHTHFFPDWKTVQKWPLYLSEHSRAVEQRVKRQPLLLYIFLF